MALSFSKYTRGALRTSVPDSGEVVAVRYKFALTTAILGAANDIVDLGVLPANCRVVDAVLDADDMDSNGTPTLAFDVGIMTGRPGDALDTDGVTARTCGNEFFAASTVGQAGGSARMSAKGGFRVAPVGYDRSIGLKIQAAAATPVAGEIGLTVFMQSAPGGMA